MHLPTDEHPETGHPRRARFPTPCGEVPPGIPRIPLAISFMTLGNRPPKNQQTNEGDDRDFPRSYIEKSEGVRHDDTFLPIDDKRSNHSLNRRQQILWNKSQIRRGAFRSQRCQGLAARMNAGGKVPQGRTARQVYHDLTRSPMNCRIVGNSTTKTGHLSGIGRR